MRGGALIVVRAVAVAIFALAAWPRTASAQTPASDADLRRYLDDARFRRAALERSLTTRSTSYAAERLHRYASGDALDWDRRPAWNPSVAVGGETPRPLAIPADRTTSAAVDHVDRAAFTALGAEAFARYPAQLAPYLQHSVDGAVRVELPDGAGWALSCASCHVRRAGRARIVGAGNDTLDLGALMRPRQAWGPGRVDVSSPDGDDPQRIPDLRSIRWLSHLQHGVAVAQSDEIALAIRLETLIITAHGGAVRPPREVALGLALYLWSLADTLPPVAAKPPPAFTRHCAACHRPPHLTGPPIAAAQTHADPAHALRPERSHGIYRVPSLRGVSTRGPLLHDGTAPDLATVLTHFHLNATDHQAILSYLSRL